MSGAGSGSLRSAEGRVKQALVTGASGFVGRHLVAALNKAEYRVVAPARVAGAEQPGLRWVPGIDLAREVDWLPLIEQADVVFHLAALAHQLGADSRLDPAFDAVNHRATASLAHAVGRCGRPVRLVFVSSIGALCTRANRPVDGSFIPAPDSAYGRSKLAAEEAIRRSMPDAAGPDWCIVRPPLVYGPGNPGNMARLLRLVSTGLPLPLGGIRNRRSVVYVGNLVDALLACASAPGAARRTFLVADAAPCSTPELVRLIARAAGREARLFDCPAWVLGSVSRVFDLLARLLGRPVGLDRYALDRLSSSLELETAEIRAAIGWEPPWTTAEGLRATFGPDPAGGLSLAQSRA